MTELHNLPPQSQAVLSLVLTQGKTFEQIAELLHMDPADVRGRAHTAVLQISPPPKSLDHGHRRPILDYLLGEGPVSARVQVRTRLRNPGPTRDWAVAIAEALAPLAAEPLPLIPELEQPVVDEKPRRWRLFSMLVLATAAAGALIVAVVAGGGEKHARGHITAARGRAPQRQPRGAAVQTLRRIVLAPNGSDRSALGAGAVVRQGGSLLLLLQARGLTPNHNDSYAVWLFNGPGDARLLGFVAPQVGAAGTFSSGVALPDDAIRFHALLVTRETQARPLSPGPTVLRSTLSLS